MRADRPNTIESYQLFSAMSKLIQNKSGNLFLNNSALSSEIDYPTKV